MKLIVIGNYNILHSLLLNGLLAAFGVCMIFRVTVAGQLLTLLLELQNVIFSTCLNCASNFFANLSFVICSHLNYSCPDRMLFAFCEQTKGEKLPENISDQEMLEMVMARYYIVFSGLTKYLLCIIYHVN